MTNIQQFIKESAFEEALIQQLKQHGWGDSEVIKHPSEEELIKNWADILYKNNREIDRLGNYSLTATEMGQVINEVNKCDSPFATNRFINGEQVSVLRDNPDDKNNFGKKVYLKIFDAQKICSGQSTYQIVQQPHFSTVNELAGSRRGDVMLLINGMPVIHIELKRSRVDVSQAVYQIKRYMHEGVFQSGIYSLIQIFVAMTPEETLYFANPGTDEAFKSENWFHWEDFNNVVVKDWQRVTQDLLSIPMAHRMVGFYTIADEKDKVLKVLRPYQYYAVTRISDRTHLNKLGDHSHRGGYIWHTTGSGKTMTSFKAAQLISNSGDADKVVFIMDRIELSVQSLDEYRGFAGENDVVQDTQDTTMLLSKLLSTDNDDRLIVTSIQKMSNIQESATISKRTIETIDKKQLVFIIDECHRSVFGKMLMNIKRAFPRALLFGFTGTPVFEKNAHGEITTETIFGEWLHKYTIANAIPDGNVLGFDLTMVNTYVEDELREKAAFSQIGIHDIAELDDCTEDQKQLYHKFMEELQMEKTYTDENGKNQHGIEYYLPKELYKRKKHHNAVAKNIFDNWQRFSKNGKFHAILATKSIKEAIEYYHLFKDNYSALNVATVFDNNIDNSDDGIAKEDNILEILNDYNLKYHTTFQLATYVKYKKDVAKRLAHKKPYLNIETDHAQQIDLLIVVSQMLTGYDSKWVNTLYVDRTMQYIDIIQSFSRTNRLFGPDKPFGNILYYTYPYSMRVDIEEALKLYVDRPLGLFVDKLEANLMKINTLFIEIRNIFQHCGIENFEKLPNEREDRNMFAKKFSEMTRKLEAAKIQGFSWDKAEYEFQNGDTYNHVRMQFDENTYNVLMRRYRELFIGNGGDRGSEEEDFDYPIDIYITEMDAGTIDAEYINSRFERYLKKLHTEGQNGELTKSALEELHKAFASLSQEDQKTATVIIHHIQSGDFRITPGKTIYDYITEFQIDKLHKQILALADATGLNASQLENIIKRNVTERTLNENGQFDRLKQTLDFNKTKEFVSKVQDTVIIVPLVMVYADKLLREFILDGSSRERILKSYISDEESNVDDIDNNKNADKVYNLQPHYDYLKVAEDIKGWSEAKRLGILRKSIVQLLETSKSALRKQQHWIS
ncbi:MAG: HsdR family type I site-specific deoxyribonuclease, partial [Prevotella sp.]|nr:HsdR family type I site-specific deoxyribonuclease [Prevotella sp.]